MNNERWRYVVGFPHYQVSSLGRIRSDRRQGASGKILKTRIGSTGYPLVSVYGTSPPRNRRVHHLVLEAFVGKRQRGMMCNHKNGVKADNQLSNLEWVTRKRNSEHAVEMGLMNPPRGSNHANAKLSERQVLAIRRMARASSHDDIAIRYGVSESAIQKIISRFTWKHI